MKRSLLMQRKLEAARSFAERLLASPARDHIAKIIVFGSVAKGTARPDSDVDVIVCQGYASAQDGRHSRFPRWD